MTGINQPFATAPTARPRRPGRPPGRRAWVAVAALVIQEPGGAEVTVTTSQGVSEFPRHGKRAETVMQNADKALYRAKESGRNCNRSAR